ncbi:hypothetical protein D3C87_2102520 [compost metagenome]
MRLEQGRNFLPGQPAGIVKDVDAGLGIPAAMQDLLGNVRGEILAIQYVPFQRVNARPVAGYQERIE